jgi:hypothetical protein
VLLNLIQSLEFLKAEFKVKAFIEAVLKKPLKSTLLDAVKYGELIQFLNAISPSSFPPVKYDVQYENNPNLKDEKKYVCASTNVLFEFL